MGWFSKRGHHRVWGVGGYADALRLNGWTPADDDTPDPEVELQVEFRPFAVLTDDEQAEAVRVIREETGPSPVPQDD